MKVTVLLRNDHDALKDMFNKFKKSGPRNQEGKKALFDEMRKEILIHSQMEKEIFYPALSGTASTRAADLVANQEQQHRSMEKLVQELEGMNGSEKNFESKLTQLMDQVLMHIEQEEEEIFEEARKNIPEYRLEELGLEMEHRKKILTTLAA
jgi:iron-sulfur cluster repair protein YtfE (RIC family)